MKAVIRRIGLMMIKMDYRHFVIIMTLVILGSSIGFISDSSAQNKNLWNPDFQHKMIQETWRKNKGSGFQTLEKWYAFCNKTGTNYNNRNGGRIELGKSNPNINNYVQMAGPYNTEPEARSWVNRSCSSWRCDWNGGCIGSGGTGGSGGGGPSCPPGMVFQDAAWGQGRCVPSR